MGDLFYIVTTAPTFYLTFHGLMNSINWPASSVWVFMAQLVEHCSANVEATGSNPVEAPKTFFRATLQLLKLRFNCDGHIFISLGFVVAWTADISEGTNT